MNLGKIFVIHKKEQIIVKLFILIFLFIVTCELRIYSQTDHLPNDTSYLFIISQIKQSLISKKIKYTNGSNNKKIKKALLIPNDSIAIDLAKIYLNKYIQDTYKYIISCSRNHKINDSIYYPKYIAVHLKSQPIWRVTILFPPGLNCSPPIIDLDENTGAVLYIEE